MIQYPRYRQHRFSSFQVIIAGFAAVDLVGALLLMLPIAAQQRCVTQFHEALFTSTSALCVTGLVVQDTGSYWSVFGQSVILLLIQIGGLGVITVGAAFLRCFLGERSPSSSAARCRKPLLPRRWAASCG